MQLPICTDGLALPVSQELIDVLNAVLKIDARESTNLEHCNALTFNFRDSNYSPDTGGYHPVEIRLSRRDNGFVFDYLTEFSFVGAGRAVELAKEMDFDINRGVFESRGLEPLAISKVATLYKLFEANFLAYHRMGVFEVSVEVERC